jgi:hypothetical protein
MRTAERNQAGRLHLPPRLLPRTKRIGGFGRVPAAVTRRFPVLPATGIDPSA